MAIIRTRGIFSLCALACLLSSSLLTSCTTIQLVSDYDDQTDTDATAIQKDVETFFVKLETATTPAARSFANNQDFYQREDVAIATLAMRVQAVPKNSLTIEQVELLEENVAWLALLHKGCVGGALSDAQRAAVKARGIDPSIACRTEYGADTDRPNQSASTLNPIVARDAHKLIDQGLTAIITLELAKKRAGSTKQGS